MSIKTYNAKYTEAFQKYLRTGSSLNESYLINKSAPHNDMNFYIWRTQEDDRVRPKHAENNGKIFSYNAPPPTDHPGKEFNCRCFAEEVNAKFDGNEDEISYYDINTWPLPPISGTLTPGKPILNNIEL